MVVRARVLRADARDLAQRDLGVVERLDALEHVALERADALLDGREEELLLVAEVVVERALRDAGGAGDAIDRRARRSRSVRSNRWRCG